MKNLQKILNSGKTVFSIKDLQKILGYKNIQSIRNFAFRRTKNGFFVRCSNGLYCLKNFNIYELANKVKSISYISLETVLKNEGIIFQNYDKTIFSVSNRKIEKQILGYNFLYFKIKDEILLNPIGLIYKGNYMIASKERAVCDKIYLNRKYYFDNLRPLDKNKLRNIAQIYPNYVILEIKKLLDGIR